MYLKLLSTSLVGFPASSDWYTFQFLNSFLTHSFNMHFPQKLIYFYSICNIYLIVSLLDNCKSKYPATGLIGSSSDVIVHNDSNP